MRDKIELTWDTDPRPEIEPTPEYPAFSEGPVEPVNIDIPHKNPERIITLWAITAAVVMVVLGLLVVMWAADAFGTPIRDNQGPNLNLEADAVIAEKFSVAAAPLPSEPIARKTAPLPKPKPRPQIAVSRAATTNGFSSARASWYGPGLYGGRTADGTPYTPSTWCVAHKSLPFGTKVEIVYNGKSVVVPVKDRGPFTPGREFDLSGAVASALGFGGVQTIQYRIVR